MGMAMRRAVAAPPKAPVIMTFGKSRAVPPPSAPPPRSALLQGIRKGVALNAAPQRRVPDDHPRSALLGSIRKGVALNAAPQRRVPDDHPRSALLGSIREGVLLQKVAKEKKKGQLV